MATVKELNASCVAKKPLLLPVALLTIECTIDGRKRQPRGEVKDDGSLAAAAMADKGVAST
ncbi:hypothetical protein EDD73_11417 [Heliophilum fasciatum]|uniref:Uncharacterized protein n=1 Tax=Heliophilum fasciatum TaxID=35700 RepID=A0A4R2RJ81_9FIRM|nr:hypothetical protein [Heliophilum fasciatum]TCP63870.1 hypothetical protein EDD73_11417 [Heliophilum fasciatum]